MRKYILFFMWSVVDNSCNVADSNNIKQKFILATFSKTFFILLTHIIRFYESVWSQ